MSYPLVTFGVIAAVAFGTVLYYYLQREGPQTYTYTERGGAESVSTYRSFENQTSSRTRALSPYLEAIDCCAICLDGLKAQKTKIMSCGHMYHEDCINKWLTTKSTCPLCRAGTEAGTQ